MKDEKLTEQIIGCAFKMHRALGPGFLGKEHEAQLVNYLVASGIDTGLLIGFGGSVVVRRKFRSARNPVNPENPVNPVK